MKMKFRQRGKTWEIEGTYKDSWKVTPYGTVNPVFHVEIKVTWDGKQFHIVSGSSLEALRSRKVDSGKLSPTATKAFKDVEAKFLGDGRQFDKKEPLHHAHRVPFGRTLESHTRGWANGLIEAVTAASTSDSIDFTKVHDDAMNKLVTLDDQGVMYDSGLNIDLALAFRSKIDDREYLSPKQLSMVRSWFYWAEEYVGFHSDKIPNPPRAGEMKTLANLFRP